MEFIFDLGLPFIIFLFVIVMSFIKNVGKAARADQDGEQTPKWKRMYDTWEDVVGKIEKEMKTFGEAEQQKGFSEPTEVTVERTDYAQFAPSTVDRDAGRERYRARQDDSEMSVTTSSRSLKLGKQDIVNGIIMSEVLGKPRAMKPYRYGKYSK